MNVERHQAVIIGGGPAGLAAAIRLRQKGGDDVVVLEREHRPGGILRQCIHDGFGLTRFGETLSGPEYAQRFVAQAEELGITCLTDTTVLSLEADRTVTASGPAGLKQLRGDAVILTMGCRERTRGALAIPGSRPAGIYTAGVAQEYINLRNLMVGREVVILGSGESQYENFFSDLCGRHPGRVGTYIGFEPKLSQEIYAGADAFIMPSKSEPCGLAQMVACRYGTPPIVRETGGLRDSIHDSTMGDGNGFTFAGYNAHELYEACWRAKEGYWNKEGWPVLVKRAMECDFSWSNSAKSYEGLYNEVVNLW